MKSVIGAFLALLLVLLIVILNSILVANCINEIIQRLEKTPNSINELQLYEDIVQLVLMFTGTSLAAIPFIGFVFTNSLYSGVFAMVGGLILVPLVSAFTPKCDESKVNEVFTCYDSQVTVSVTDTLGK